jgi:formamidopyrimidine-DNA glycosylase
MFELPEFITLAKQINETLPGKTIAAGRLGNSPHKFVWYNLMYDQFARLSAGKTMSAAYARGKWLFINLEPGYVLVVGECGGKLLYHPPGDKLPEKYHLWLTFKDGSSLTALTQMWGAYELYKRGEELERKYIKGMRPTPVEAEFTFTYFSELLDSLLKGEKRSAKSLLTQDQLIPGLGNAIAQDILFNACIHPRKSINDLDSQQRRVLFNTIQSTLQEVIAAGGRCDELDLFRQPGKYQRLMDSHAEGKPCPRCTTPVVKIQYLGGACYLCPSCQPI